VLLHDQVAAQIRRALADGEAKPGERLPSARHLAAVMHVNTNTVLRALRLLRTRLLELRPGHGSASPALPSAACLSRRRSRSSSSRADSSYDRAELLNIIKGLPDSHSGAAVRVRPALAPRSGASKAAPSRSRTLSCTSRAQHALWWVKRDRGSVRRPVCQSSRW